MAKSRKRKSPTQIEYDKQVRRIKNLMRKASKRGYQFSADIIPEKPKRVTKATVARLAKITPEKIYKKAIYAGSLAETPVSGTRGRELEKQEAQRKRKETIRIRKEKTKRDKERPTEGEISFQNLFDNFIKKLSSPTPIRTASGRLKSKTLYEISDLGRTSLYSFTMMLVAEYGEEEIGNRISSHYSELEGLVDYVLYGSDGAKINTCEHAVVRILSNNTISLTDMAEIMEEQEANEEWEEPQ